MQRLPHAGTPHKGSHIQGLPHTQANPHRAASHGGRHPKASLSLHRGTSMKELINTGTKSHRTSSTSGPVPPCRLARDLSQNLSFLSPAAHEKGSQHQHFPARGPDPPMPLSGSQQLGC